MTEINDSPSDTRWALVALAVGAGVVTAFHIGKAPPALPLIRAELGLGPVMGGWVISVFSVIGATLALGAGSIADRVGHRRAMLAGLGFAAIGSFLGALAGDAWLLLGSRVLEGLGFVMVAVAAPSVIALSTGPGDRRMALGIWGSYLPFGASLMMVAAPLVLVGAGWRGLWQIMALVTVFAIIAVAWGSGKSLDHKPEGGSGSVSHKDNLVRTLSRPGPWLLATCFAFYTMPYGAMMAWLPSFLIEQHGLSIAAAASLTALMIFCNAPGNLLAGWLLKRHWPHWLLIAMAGGVMGLSSLGFFWTALPDLARFSLTMVFSFFGGMLPATVLSGVVVFAPSPAQIGTTNGFLVQGANLGLFLGPPVFAAVVAATGGWESSVYLIVASTGVVVLLSLLVRRVEAAQ